MADTPVLRKVQLDSIDDLRFIYENLVKAAREKIELHVPPSAAPGEEGGSARKGSKRATRRSTGGAGGGGAGAVVDGGGGGKGVDGSAAGEGGDPLKRKVEELVMEVCCIFMDFFLGVGLWNLFTWSGNPSQVRGFAGCEFGELGEFGSKKSRQADISWAEMDSTLHKHSTSPPQASP